jgi:phosphoribosyl-AMP cyclohydrolase
VTEAAWIDEIQWSADGLVPAIAQDGASGRVLMFAYMNRDALLRTVETKEAHYWSRSRGRLWHKGEESGHTQRVIDIGLDCDGDVVLLSIEQVGGIACHTGRESCFFRRLVGDKWVVRDAVMLDPAVIYSDSKGARS